MSETQATQIENMVDQLVLQHPKYKELLRCGKLQQDKIVELQEKLRNTEAKLVLTKANSFNSFTGKLSPSATHEIKSLLTEVELLAGEAIDCSVKKIPTLVENILRVAERAKQAKGSYFAATIGTEPKDTQTRTETETDSALLDKYDTLSCPPWEFTNKISIGLYNEEDLKAMQLVTKYINK